MRYRKKNNIVDFFNVSIVLPCLNEVDGLTKVLPKNVAYFQRNGIEIIIVVHDPIDEKRLIDIVSNYPFVNFKVITNKNTLEKSNLSRIINIGIEHASFDYILIMSPESELFTDIIYQLRYVIYHYPLSYATGVVTTSKYDANNFKNQNWTSYGCIMIAKSDLIRLDGYDENCNGMGRENEHISKKLDALGLIKMKLPDAKVIRSSRKKETPVRKLKNNIYPSGVGLSNKCNSQDFNEVIWNWKTHKSLSQLEEFTNIFQKYSFINNQICEKNYEIIALIQVRNESKNLVEILPHLDKYCDGIILLDDGSNDDSYEIALHNKLLLKVQKKYKGYFDDLENRNELLKLASFFKSKWFFFIDADERFDPRYSNIRVYVNNDSFDVYRFQLVDLWDSPETYRVDIPDRGENGITTRARMFKNKGSMQIYTNREIHFPAVPYSQNSQQIQILLLHYGNFERKIRERKYKLYKSQDPDEKKQAHSYEFLKDQKVILKSLKNIKLNNV